MACPLSGPFAAGEVTFSPVTHGHRTELEGPWCSSVIGRVRGMGQLGAVNGVRELALSVDDPVDGADQGSTSSSMLLSRKSMPGLATHLVCARDRGPGRPDPGTLSHCPPPYENCCPGVIRDDRAGTAGGDWPQDESWAQVAETRAAVVFLAGDWACKLKKAGQSRLPRLQHRGGPRGGIRPRGRAQPQLRARRVPGRPRSTGRTPGLRPPDDDATHARVLAAVHAGPLAGRGGRAAGPGWRPGIRSTRRSSTRPNGCPRAICGTMACSASAVRWAACSCTNLISAFSTTTSRIPNASTRFAISRGKDRK